MSGLNDKISALQSFLNILSWMKILQLSIILVIISMCAGVYENRESIYNFANQSRLAKDRPVSRELSKPTQTYIDTIVQKSPNIIGIQVTAVDFQKNTRIPIYASLDSIPLQQLYDRYNVARVDDLPLFTGDITNNKRLIDLVNGEFLCDPFLETIPGKLEPLGAKYVTSICMQGIPPYYGKFSGLVSIYLKENPTLAETDQLRTITRDLSLLIYENDFK